MSTSRLLLAPLLLLLGYLVHVRRHRFRRRTRLSEPFEPGRRDLGSMTLNEAYAITEELQTLEFPTAFDKARAYALLKTGGIPTISKLLMATGQNTSKNAPKRAIDTNILLMEIQTNPVTSDRHAMAIARVNYLHSRFRAAGKILDEDMLHTLADGLAEIMRWVNDHEWRRLSDAEICALGVWHKALGEAMDIPFTNLPSSGMGWSNGVHFAQEMIVWAHQYEARVAVSTPNNSAFVNNYFESKAGKMPSAVKQVLKRLLAANVDKTMRTSMGLPKPGAAILLFNKVSSVLRWLCLRYLCLPRHPAKARKHVAETPNPGSNKYNFSHRYVEPWYLKASHPRQVDPTAYRASGYDINNLGPIAQEGKGVDEMKETMTLLLGSDRADCPFSTNYQKPRK